MPKLAASTKPDVSALAPWFGSNRTLARHVGRCLRGCAHVAIPFCGGLCELTEIDARTVNVNDLHRHVINLATVARDRRADLQAALRWMLFHPDALTAAQESCFYLERCDTSRLSDDERLRWAVDYFVCCWMARSSEAGAEDEFDAPLSVRWDAGGGDSPVRFRNAVESLEAWEGLLKRCTFTCLDAFDFIGKVKDDHRCGVYCDPPWPDDGDKYKHKFDEGQQRRLAARLGEFRRCRIVVRYGDHPLVRELYPEASWRWHRYSGRRQSNRAKAEVLITRRAS